MGNIDENRENTCARNNTFLLKELYLSKERTLTSLTKRNKQRNSEKVPTVLHADL